MKAVKVRNEGWIYEREIGKMDDYRRRARAHWERIAAVIRAALPIIYGARQRARIIDLNEFRYKVKFTRDGSLELAKIVRNISAVFYYNKHGIDPLTLILSLSILIPEIMTDLFMQLYSLLIHRFWAHEKKEGSAYTKILARKTINPKARPL